MATSVRDLFDHSRPVTCTVCAQRLRWDESLEAWVDAYGVDVCKDSDEGDAAEYWAHDLHQDLPAL